MLNNIKNRTKDQKGFTIIEVLIVLAIAGLILLIVFLAIPALQRNSRNTQRRTDVSALGGAINEFVANNAGAPPTVAQVTGSGAAVANAKLGYYTPATSDVFGNNTGTPTSTVTTTSGATPSATVLTKDSVIIWIGYDCSAGAAAAPVAASGRSIAIEFATETGGTPTVQCSAT